MKALALLTAAALSLLSVAASAQTIRQADVSKAETSKDALGVLAPWRSE